MGQPKAIGSESGIHQQVDDRTGAPAVLIVDDVEANLISIEALLDGMDCQVVLVKSGNAALRQLLRREFAVMLLDVQMPEMDGFEVASHVSQNPATRDTPIVFLTAMHESDGHVLKGYGSGAVDFLFKPINPTILRGKVRVFLDLYRARQKLTESRHALETAYQNLATTHSQLVQSAKMASLGELVAGIAHEINNPLSFLQSHLHTVRRSLAEVEPALGTSLPEPLAKHWERARNRLSEMDLGLDRVAELVIKLRTFSRLDEGAVKTVSVRECVESVLTISRHRMGEGIVVRAEYGEPDQLECYSGLLNQAIMNLVSNAIDAMAEGGTLSIATGQVGDRYQISVGDTGIGIPEELRHKVCEPFFTTKPPGQGTGLGLSLTYSIVQKHGGTLEIEDNGERGTRMTISVPFVLDAKSGDAQARARVAALGQPANESRSTERALEGEPAVRQMGR
jgi:two-component system, NtrC family, sensor kinase